ncbi:MAG TPA: decarboxylating 6-phosphogluconate dehydrogenase, partial [Ilumatobacteraceae bacterium]|nr:decarboxylating 6-phosphogluconate dehydrogenase [Ilumatobacteraceae bacterium]
MQLAMVGLGRMGSNMVRRLQRAGHDCVAYDLNPEAIKASEADGARGAGTPQQVVDALTMPRHIWLMVPAAYVGSTIEAFAPLLSPGDTLIDGGNSWYHDDVDRAAPLRDRGINYLDVGTSGGVFGLERGYCLMVGGPTDAVAEMSPIFDDLAPGFGGIERTPGYSGDPHPAEKGWLHCGKNGAGHFVKMVHNGIEYGLMAAFAEGLNILSEANIGADDRPKDAETAPLNHPQYYQYEFDLGAITEVWRRGSVVSSWLLDLTAAAFAADPHLDGFEGVVSDSGEGRWTAHAAIDEGVPAPILSAALSGRFDSRGRSNTANKILSALRA